MMNSRTSLKHRVDSRRELLEQRLFQIRTNAHAGVRDERTRLREKLSDLDRTLRHGWNRLSNRGANRLERWLSH